MTQNNWEADKMLDVYIHDYLVKKKLHASAKAFMAEGKVATDPVAIDPPGGFLFEWWSVFWDIFIARTDEKHSEAASAYIEAQQMKAKEQQQQQQLQQQQLQQQQLQQQHLQQQQFQQQQLQQQLQILQQRNVQLQRGVLNHASLSGPGNELSAGIVDANRIALLKTANVQQGQLGQNNSGSMDAALQKIQGRSHLTTDIKSEAIVGPTQNQLPVDPSSIYRQAILQSKSGLGSPGINPLKGYPLTGANMGVQVQKPTLPVQNQYLLQAQQQVPSHAPSQNTIGNSPNYGDMDSQRFIGLPKGSLNGKETQSSRNEACSPMHSSSSQQMKVSQIQQPSSQQPDQLPQQQLPQNNRKRKQASSSGPVNSTGTGNTVGPSASSPPSTHTPGDGTGTANSSQQASNVPKNVMMYGTEGTGGLTSSNQLDDIEHFGDVGCLDYHVESLLAHGSGDGRDLYGTLKQSPPEQKAEPSKGFTFGEVSSINARCIFTSCHFNSDGDVLAIAGRGKKAVLWNVNTLCAEYTAEEHKAALTDVRFRPDSTHLATASLDGSVRLWDRNNLNYCLNIYHGHGSAIVSLDFHPKKTDIFCFCNQNNEIQYWNMSPFSCARISKGGSSLVRFQPRVGQYLAAAADKAISIIDVETDRVLQSFQGHSGAVNYMCWDTSGEYVASASEDCVKVWSLTSGDCIHELALSGEQFYSCVFHPSYSSLLVVGGKQSLELWNIADNKSMTIRAHEDIIGALAASSVTGRVASAGHDGVVKVWG